MRRTLARLIFKISRQPFLRPLVPWLFSMFNFAIPLQRLRETDTLLAFYHPAPVYPLHVLIVPRRPIASMDMLNGSDQALLAEVISIVQSLVIELNLNQAGYRLIVNGGAYQDIPLLHFHLVSGAAL